jgi:hypothetical protein
LPIKIEFIAICIKGIQMSALTPMTRDEMRSLKDKTDEENRVRQVEQCVERMYTCAINTAKTFTSSQWRAEFYNGQCREGFDGMFVIKNINDILSGLRRLFPDCSVEFKSVSVAMGPDRKMHDISNLDKNILMFLGNTGVKQYIVISWG